MGLPASSLMLTILFVMLAEVLIYVPSIASFRLNWLNDRPAAAHTAALVPTRRRAAWGRRRLPGDPQQRRRPRGGDEDGQAAPPAGGLRLPYRPQSA